ncbi:MAG: glycosyltransferase family 4 protein, partial [Cyanobacteria bacterium P01_G01_bin.49]
QSFSFMEDVLDNLKIILVQIQQNDVFLLTSDFEGMPISLLEAMGRGCIPVVTDIASGIPELVGNGIHGFRVPVGDIESFADRLTELAQNLDRRQEMALNAYQKISQGGYRTEDMVKKYIQLFERVKQEVEEGIYQRPRGQILAPPQLRYQLRNPWKDKLSDLIRKLSNYGKRLLSLLYSGV